MEDIETTPCSSFVFPFFQMDQNSATEPQKSSLAFLFVTAPRPTSSKSPFSPFIYLPHDNQIFMECLLCVKLHGLSDSCCPLCLKYTSHVHLSWMNYSPAFKCLPQPLCEGFPNPLGSQTSLPLYYEHHFTV